MNILKPPILALTWIPVICTVANHFYQPYQVTGSSMAPTFNPATTTTAQDVVLVSKYKATERELQRGDIVMFNSPMNAEKVVTKRVVAIQGDVVLPRHPYPKRTVVVPRNHFWVEGDNSLHSIDLNTFGPVSQALVVGKVMWVVWPPSRIGVNMKRA